MTTVAILGLGEAGTVYARGLRDAGAVVRGYDPRADAGGSVLARARSLEDAVAGADIVLSLVWARTAVAAARDALPFVSADAVYADLNTAAPETKREVAAIADATGVAVADVAVLAPVARAGHRTPLATSGPGAAAFAARMRPLGVPIDVIPGTVGAAARLKLLRSVFMKGLATLVIEGLEGARAAGAEEWLLAQIAGELGADGPDRIEQLVAGTHTHAGRREQEVRDALAALERSGTPTDMTRATLAWFERLNRAPGGAHGER